MSSAESESEVDEIDDDFERESSMSPGQLWRRSETPPESFSDAEGADDDGLWPVQIVGEEYDGEGNLRYEAKWDNWTRADGSNVTWNNDLLAPEDIERWENIQKKRREQLAKESLDITIWTTLDIHNEQTHLRAQAYEEKLKLRQQNPLNLLEKMESLLDEKENAMDTDEDGDGGGEGRKEEEEEEEEEDDSPAGNGASKRNRRSPSSSPETPPGSTAASSRHVSRTRSAKRLRTGFNSHQPVVSGFRTAAAATAASSSPSASTRSQTRVTESPGTSYRSTTMSSTRGRTPSYSATSVSTPASAPSKGKGKGKGKGKPVVAEPRAGASERFSSRTLFNSPSKHSKRREQLERQWNTVTQSSRAASVTIVNEVDDEAVPILPSTFQYIETGYVYSKYIPRLVDDLFVRCECEHCSSPAECSCQGPSELVDEKQEKIFAYTPEGLFAFNIPNSVEVVECNKFCRCDPYTCPNRVAQQPRDIPIEIFKTSNCGWGVRSSVDIPSGKVLGMFTGLLVPRDCARGGYSFDLDSNENPDDEEPEEAYSVDAEKCGNWTRFINHSCEPNLQIYSVVYDTIPGTNMPYLGFVAKRDVPAGEELTLDYAPSEAGAVETDGEGKGKRKAKGKKEKSEIPPGARECMCSAASCRGWVNF